MEGTKYDCYEIYFQKIKRIFKNTFLCCKVNIYDSETLCITFSPFKII